MSDNAIIVGAMAATNKANAEASAAVPASEAVSQDLPQPKDAEKIPPVPPPESPVPLKGNKVVKAGVAGYRQLRKWGLDNVTIGIMILAWVLYPVLNYDEYAITKSLIKTLIHTVVMPIVVIIVNEIRKSIKPTIQITGNSFSDVLKAKVYWSIGPQVMSIVFIWMILYVCFKN